MASGARTGLGLINADLNCDSNGRHFQTSRINGKADYYKCCAVTHDLSGVEPYIWVRASHAKWKAA
jgi:hypothetical protein